MGASWIAEAKGWSYWAGTRQRPEMGGVLLVEGSVLSGGPPSFENHIAAKPKKMILCFILTFMLFGYVFKERKKISIPII